MEIDSIAPDAEITTVRATRNQSMAGSLELKFDTDRLKIFYERIFPYQLFFKWLSYNKMKIRDDQTL
jgi:hypothetical protein